jgi:hypothetical protein
MHVVVEVSEEVAGALKQLMNPSKDSRELLEVTRRLGVSLTPISPGMDDPLLRTMFDVEVPKVMAERVVDELKKCGAVKTAYIKPPDEMPR